MHVILKLLKTARRIYYDARQKTELSQLKPIACDTQALANISGVNLAEIFQSLQTNQEWLSVEQEISALQIGNNGGSNSGDSRAVYYLLRHLRPTTVLEIGTCRGATLARMALALRKLKAETNCDPKIVTVDIEDVNSDIFWSGVNRFSPQENVRRLGCVDTVYFVIENSISFFRNSKQKFDLIFLDGSHISSVVYQEIPLALSALSPNGWILLHDYYPNGKPLFDDAYPILGPFEAVRRLQREGIRIQVLPFGNLPWWTRSNSTLTSLALLGKS